MSLWSDFASNSHGRLAFAQSTRAIHVHEDLAVLEHGRRERKAPLPG